MFSRYAALVKNLRGVVLLNPNEEGVLDTVRWLSKRFKYRSLGLPPVSVQSLGGRASKPFRELAYPVQPLKDLVALLSRDLPSEVAELLVFASSYISPALVVGSTYLPTLEDLAVDSVRVSRDLSVPDWKLHLRIADYTVLDMYEECVEEAMAVLRGLRDPREVVKRRRERIARDRRRYWRIACEGGKPFLIYIDNLSVALMLGLLKEPHEEWAAALSVVAAVCIPAGMR